MATLMVDLRHGIRSLARRPAFALVTAGTLALGIGANVAAFSLLHRLVLDIAPFPDADRLVMLHEEIPEKGYLRSDLSAPNYLDFAREASSFQATAAWSSRRMNLSGDGEPVSVRVSRVSAGFFSILGARPLFGRGFTAEEDRYGGARVALLGYGLWQGRFGGEESVLGRSVSLDGATYQVVGVMGSSFELPFTLPQSEADLYVPMAFTPDELRRRGAHNIWALACLEPGVTVAAADREIKKIASELAVLYPDENASRTGAVYPLQSESSRRTRTPTLLLMGVVALVLLIACSNVASLFLARGLERRRELATRAALGAGRGTLLRQLLTESVVLGLLGGVGGVVVAQLVMSSFPTLLPGVPKLAMSVLDGRLLMVALAVSLLATVIFGVLPAWQVTRLSPTELLKEGARGSGGRAQQRTHSILVVVQVALATTLLVGAGLLLRSLGNLRQVRPGFDPDHLLTASCVRPGASYPDRAARQELHERLRERLLAIPGVEAAALGDTVPLGGGFRMNNTYHVEGQEQPPGHWLLAFERSVTPGFFAAMGIPVLQGRDFAADDWDRPVAVINQFLAAKHWPGESPLGKQISLSGRSNWRTIIGVVGNVRQESLTEDAHGEAYKPLAQESRFGYLSFALRLTGGSEGMPAALQGALHQVDSDLALYDTRTGRGLMQRQLQASVAGGVLIGFFSALALLLAAVGLHGVVSLLVGLRRTEIGIRMALGAGAGDVVRMVLADGLRLVLIGCVMGLLAAIALSRVVAGLLYGVTPTDAPTFLLAPLVLLVAALVACAAPIRRAVTVHPAVTLREG